MHEHEHDWNSYVPTAAKTQNGESLQLIQQLASENAVVIFSVSSCCMCHAIKKLFRGMGVNPAAYELDGDPRRGKDMEDALVTLVGRGSSSSDGVPPVVFIGGMLVGGTEAVMTSHINGTLVPLLKEAGALWL